MEPSLPIVVLILVMKQQKGQKRRKGEEANKLDWPVEEDIDRDGADVPDGMGIQDPEQRWEVQELQ